MKFDYTMLRSLLFGIAGAVLAFLESWLSSADFGVHTALVTGIGSFLVAQCWRWLNANTPAPPTTQHVDDDARAIIARDLERDLEARRKEQQDAYRQDDMLGGARSGILLLLTALLLLPACAVANDAAGLPADLRLIGPAQIAENRPIQISLDLRSLPEPRPELVITFEVARQSHPEALCSIVQAHCGMTECYVWADPGEYEILATVQLRSDALVKRQLTLRLLVTEGRALPRLTPRPLPIPGEPRIPEEPDDPVPKEPETPPKVPPRTDPPIPREPETPTEPVPPTDEDLGGKYGLALKLRDKIITLVPEEYQDRSPKLAEVYRQVAKLVIKDEVTPLNAGRKLKSMNAEALPTPEEQQAWEPLLSWVSTEFTQLAKAGRLGGKTDVVVALSEVSLGFSLVAVQEGE